MSPPNLWKPPGNRLARPNAAEWLEILQTGAGELLAAPFESNSRLPLARTLYARGFHTQGRICMSGRVVPMFGREYFPSRVPTFSVHDGDAEARGVTVYRVDPPSRVPDWIPASIGVDPAHESLWARPRWKRDNFVAAIEDGACVASQWGYAIFDKSGSYATDFCFNDGPLIPFAGIAPPVTKVSGTVAVMMHFCSHAVFHWMVETLPRFELLRMAEQLSKVDHFLVRYMLPWHWEFVDLLGLPREKFVSVGDICHIQADRLLVCSNVEESDFTIMPQYFEPEPWVTDLIARLAPDTGPAKPDQRIYITRENAPSRKVGNNAELWHMLEQYGFKKVFFEDKSFAQKAEIMRSAEVVISPTGAALTNIPLMRPGTKCVVLYCEDSVYSAKNVMCANSGIVHVHSVAPAQSRFQPEAMRQMPEHMREIFVDLGRLEMLFDLLAIERRA